MSSFKLSPCCIKTIDHEGETHGSFQEDLFGLPGYESGDKKSSKVIVLGADIYGYSYKNNLLVADQFAAAGYYVLLPDLLDKDPAQNTNPEYFGKWLQKHSVEGVSVVFSDYLKRVRKELNPKYLVGVGYCFGAKFVIQNITKDGLLDAGALAHPSFVTDEDLEAVAKPVIISAAENDSIFHPEARAKAEAILAKNKQRYEVDLFGGVSHGFAVRGDLTNPVISYAATKALNDQITWFSQFAPSN